MTKLFPNAIHAVTQYRILHLSIVLLLSALTIFTLSSAALDHHWLALQYVQDLDINRVDAQAFAKSWASKSFMLLLFKFARYPITNLLIEIILTSLISLLIGKLLLRAQQYSSWVKVAIICNFHYLLVYFLMFAIILLKSGQASELQIFPLSLHALFFPEFVLEHPLYLWAINTSLTSLLTLPILAAGYASLKGRWDLNAVLFALLVQGCCHLLRFYFLFPYLSQ